VRHVAIDGGLFQDEVEARQIMAVPFVYLNGEPFASGRMEIAEILAKVDTGAAARDAARLGAKEAFDMLIVGGGPPAPRRRSTPRARASAPASSPSASAARRWTRWHRELHLGARNRRAEVRRGAGSARAPLRGRHHEQPARVSLEPAAQPGGLASVTLANGAALKAAP
jgi:hypothetical protein